MAEEIRAEYETEQTKAREAKKSPSLRKLQDYSSQYKRGRYGASREVDTGVPLEKLAEITDALCRVPQGFHVHPKIVRLLEQRAEMGHGERAVDYGFAEALAFGSLLLEGNPVRLAGQGTQRGTFNPRHAVLVDTQTGEEYLCLAHLSPEGAPGGRPFCEIANSPL